MNRRGAEKPVRCGGSPRCSNWRDTQKIEEIRIFGTVQGVGFRPTVYRLAKACGLRGEVCNDGQGVLIRVSGSEASLEEFVQRLQQECPPLARINQLTRRRYEGEFTFNDFIISSSVSSVVKTEIAPDAATCPQCKAETFDPFSRWYRYPFTNCTHCGPRLSIIRAIPYDRHHTSMAAFAMCSNCAQEYKDVENRRFHAQPIACHICGPKATLERADGKPITASMFSMMDDVDAVCTLLQKGEIVAIKGLSGIHLACDATQETAVQKLRDSKGRDRKPFALMARDIAVIEEYCTLSAQEKELLESSAAPIVLLEKKGVGSREWGVGNKGTRGQGDKGTRGQGENFLIPVQTFRRNVSSPFPTPHSPYCACRRTRAEYPRLYATLHPLTSPNSQTNESPNCPHKWQSFRSTAMY